MKFEVAETEARNFFTEQLKEDGYKPTDMESWELELNKLIIDEDADFEDGELCRNGKPIAKCNCC